MRREILYLTDIVEAADHSELICSAAVQKLSIIGEAATHISNSMRDRHPEVPWARIVGFRNVLIHAYFGVDWTEVWLSAKERCPLLREQVAQILAEEPREPLSEADAD